MAQRLNVRLMLLAALGTCPAAHAQGALVDPTRPPTVMPSEAAGDAAQHAGRTLKLYPNIERQPIEAAANKKERR